MEGVLLGRYPDPRSINSFRDSTTLLAILETRGRDGADSIRNGLKALDKLLSIVVDNQTNITRLSVEARYPALAANVANRFIQLLDVFNAQTRQSQARERRKFIEGQLSEGEAGLRHREDELNVFYQRNRSWQQAPQLVFEEGRLRRQVDIQQELYLTLRREYEAARIEEVNDTPVITVIDPAIPPARRSSPNRALLGILALLLGVVLSLTWVFTARVLENRRRVQDAEYLEFRDLIGQLADAIRPGFLTRLKR